MLVQMPRYPTDEELAAAVGKILATVKDLLTFVHGLSDEQWEEFRNAEDRRRHVCLQLGPLRFRRGKEHPTWGATWIDVGGLRLIWCAPEHPNKWMVVWRQSLPEWNPKTKWEGSDDPGPYWKRCDARLQRKRGVDPEDAICRFPNCDCLSHLPEQQREELKRLHVERAEEGKRYKEAWLQKLGKAR